MRAYKNILNVAVHVLYSVAVVIPVIQNVLEGLLKTIPD